MTNFEYYKETILEITNSGYDVAVVNNKPVSCKDLEYCTECQLNNGNCHWHRTKWFCKEYVEQPKLTKKERQFCELVETGWISRNQSGVLYIRNNKPTKRKDYWAHINSPLSMINIEIFDAPFSFITWEDTEPWSVEDLLKLEVEE